MKTVSIEINVKGIWCNQWPNLKISLNDKVFFDGEVVETITIAFTALLLDKNKLTIQHYGKNFGANNVWDTKLEGGNIVQDRAAEIISLSLDEVDIAKYMQKKCPLVTENGDSVPGLYYGFNGCVDVEFEPPIYNWIIDNAVRPELQMAPNFNHPLEVNHATNVFDYDRDQIEIKKIEDILSQYYAYLSSKSSKV